MALLSFRRCRLVRLLPVVLLAVLSLTAHPAQAADLVLGLVPQPASELLSTSGARQLADYLAARIDRPIALRTFADDRSLHHWMNRFREVDLGLFDLAYLQRQGQGEFIPLVACRLSGHAGDVLLVARRGVDPALFTAVSQVLLEAGGEPGGQRMLEQVGLTRILPPAEAQSGRPQTVAARAPTAAPSPSAVTVVAPAPPAALSIDFPADGSRTGPAPLLLYVAPPGTQVMLDRRALEIASGERLGPLADGEHLLELVAPDGARVTSSFRVDALGPLLTVDPYSASQRAAELVLTGSREADAPLSVVTGEGVQIGAVNFPSAERWELPLSNIAPGGHRLELVGRDHYGNETRIAVVFERDLTSPQLQILSPVAGVEYRQIPPLQLEREPGELTLRLDGRVLPDPTLPESLGDGDHQLLVELRDRAGNLSQGQVVFRVDRGLPALSVDPHPQELQVTRAQLVGGREAGTTLAVQLEPVTISARIAYPAPERWGVVLDGLHEGENRVRLHLIDAAGNRSEQELRLVVDRQPPLLTIASPLPGGSYAQPPLLQLVSDGEQLELRLDGAPFSVAAGERLPALAEGEHLLQVVSRDRAGNRSEQAIPFVIDSHPPRLLVTGPIDGLVSAGPLQLQFDSDADEVQLTVDGAALAIGPDGLLPQLAEGEHLLRIEARDRAGNQVARERRVTIDRSAPQLDLVSPPSGYLAEAQPLFKVARSDGQLEVWLDGQKLPIVSGERFAPLADGAHELLLNAVDAAGNRSQLRRDFVIDTRAPAVTILEPAPGSAGRQRVRPQWRISEADAGIEVRLDGGPLDTAMGEPLGELPPGKHLLEVVAVDLAGNRGSAQVEFTVPGPGPQVYLTSPMAGVTYDRTPLLQYQAEAGQVRVLVDGREVRKRSGESLDSLGNGPHSVRVEVTNANGDVGSAEQRFAVSDDVTQSLPTASPLDVPSADTAFSIAAGRRVLPASFSGDLPLTIRGLSRLGETIYVQHWIDRNRNGVADAGEPVIGVVKLTDGLASPAAGVPGDDDGLENRVIVTRLDFRHPDDPRHRPGQYIFLAIGERDVSETVLRIEAD